MAKTFNVLTDAREEWFTPPSIIKALGKFDLDPCAPVNRPWDTAAKHLTVQDDGLNAPWEGRVWLNPPYGRKTGDWLYRLSQHGIGTALIFARTETQFFHDYIWNSPTAVAIFFFKGRLRFYTVDGKMGETAPAPSCLVAYGHKDAEALWNSGLDGRFLALV